MLNNKNLTIVKKFGDKTEFTIVRCHCTRRCEINKLFCLGLFYIFGSLMANHMIKKSQKIRVSDFAITLCRTVNNLQQRNYMQKKNLDYLCDMLHQVKYCVH